MFLCRNTIFPIIVHIYVISCDNHISRRTQTIITHITHRAMGRGRGGVWWDDRVIVACSHHWSATAVRIRNLAIPWLALAALEEKANRPQGCQPTNASQSQLHPSQALFKTIHTCLTKHDIRQVCSGFHVLSMFILSKHKKFLDVYNFSKNLFFFLRLLFILIKNAISTPQSSDGKVARGVSRGNSLVVVGKETPHKKIHRVVIWAANCPMWLQGIAPCDRTKTTSTMLRTITTSTT